MMASGELSSAALTQQYLARIEALDGTGPSLHSVIEVNPAAVETADRLDGERQAGRVLGPLHGTPILVKDNIATADGTMTTAGSFALSGHRATQDAAVVRRLRQAGALILGKANMSEWANFRSTHSTSGWSARGGQCRNPYAPDRSPWGSSSGSAVAVAANLAAAALGTETDGSIVLPASANCVVGLKPTVGLTSREGVIPLSHSQDSVGPLARTVRDAALLLGVIAGADYEQYLREGSLERVRIGIPRHVFFGYSPQADAAVEKAIGVMAELGAEIVDPADIPTAEHLTFLGSELTVLLHEFKAAINEFLSSLGPEVEVHSLADVIAFNQRHSDLEMPYFGQELFSMAEETRGLSAREYREALQFSRRQSRTQGIDAVMDRHGLDALMLPTGTPPCLIDPVLGDHIRGIGSTPAAQAGYPAISVPAGFASGLPVAVLFTGRAQSEPTLLRLAFAFEQTTKHRRPPATLS